jgi:hypothetical protein
LAAHRLRGQGRLVASMYQLSSQVSPLRLRWLQATSSGIGQFLEQSRLNCTDIIFTTAAGVHAIPQ